MMINKLLTINEVAQMLKVSNVTIHNWIQGGKIKAIVLNRTKKRKTVRIEESEVERIILDGKKNNLKQTVNQYLRKLKVIR